MLSDWFSAALQTSRKCGALAKMRKAIMRFFLVLLFTLSSLRAEAVIQVYPGNSCSEAITKNNELTYEDFISEKLDNNVTAYSYERIYEKYKSIVYFECYENELISYNQKSEIPNSSEALLTLDRWYITQLTILGLPGIDSRKSSEGTHLKYLKAEGIYHPEMQLIIWEISGFSMVALSMDEI